MATAPLGCDIIDLTTSCSSPECSDVEVEDESVTEVIRYVEKDITALAVVTFFSCLQPKSEI